MQTLSAAMGIYHLLCALWWLQRTADSQPSQRYFRSQKWGKHPNPTAEAGSQTPLFFIRLSSVAYGVVGWHQQSFQPLQTALMTTLSGTLSGLLQDTSFRLCFSASSPKFLKILLLPQIPLWHLMHPSQIPALQG